MDEPKDHQPTQRACSIVLHIHAHEYIPDLVAFDAVGDHVPMPHSSYTPLIRTPRRASSAAASSDGSRTTRKWYAFSFSELQQQ